MAASFFERVEVEGENGKTRMVEVRYAIGVRFVAAEGAAYGKLAERTGQTTGELIRSVFMGERIGGTFVGQSRGKQLRPRDYRAVLVLQLQPKTCRAVLDEQDVGTPQRMLWSCPVYRDLPPFEELPDWPGPLDWTPDQGDLRRNPADQHDPAEIRVHAGVVREVREFLWLRASGRQDGEYDGHRALLRLKAAALLGCLRTGRPVVGRADWAVAGQLLDTSDAVRNWTVSWLGDTDEQQREARLSFAEERAAREAQGRLSAESDHTRVRNVLLRAHKKHPQLKANALVKRTGRDYRIARTVLPGLIAEGLVSWPDADDADSDDG